MDTSVRHTTAIALLAVGCGFSAASHAYNAAEDAEAQDREVRAAYDRGYQAAREEMAHAAATNAGAATGAATTGAPATVVATRPATGSGAPKPILDIKHTYSDAGEVQTVMTVPVTVKPLAEGQGAQAAATAAAADTPAESPAPAAASEQTAARAEPTAPPAAPAANQQPKPRTYAQAPANHRPVQAAPAEHEEVAPQESLADDESVDNEPAPRSAQIYSTQGLGYTQPPQPQSQYAPPPTASRPPPQPYNYAPRQVYSQQQPAYPQQYAQQYPQQQPAYPQQYAQQQPYPQQYAQQYAQQQPVYAPPRPAYYAPPPAPYGAQQYPQQTRWVYWSPQYGRWMYY